MSKAIDFETTSDNVVLRGKINLASYEAPVVVLIPGVSGNALTEKFDWIAEAFVNSSYNFVRFNFRGYEANNDLEKSSLAEEEVDLKNVLKKIEDMGFKMNGYGVVAKSIGALKILSIKDKKLECLGLIAPAVSIAIGGNLNITASILYEKIGAYDEYKLSTNVLDHNFSTVMFYGEKDEVVRTEDYQRLAKNLPEPKEVYVIRNDGHSLDIPETKLFLTEKLITFFVKHFPVERP